jgi:hypothetical protein
VLNDLVTTDVSGAEEARGIQRSEDLGGRS